MGYLKPNKFKLLVFIFASNISLYVNIRSENNIDKLIC